MLLVKPLKILEKSLGPAPGFIVAGKGRQMTTFAALFRTSIVPNQWLGARKAAENDDIGTTLGRHWDDSGTTSGRPAPGSRMKGQRRAHGFSMTSRRLGVRWKGEQK